MTAPITDVAGKTFDFVVIGGGTAGLALATRLSEDPAISVLVLEAGRANLNDPLILNPGTRRAILGKPEYDWSFKTVGQTHSNNREYPWPRGKGLGGSSAINFLLWNKPAREYIDAFETLGNPGWNWDLFDKYSKKTEKFVPPEHDRDVLTYDLEHRGQNGPVITSFPLVISGVEKPLYEAMKKHGINYVRDSSSGYTNGATSIASNFDPATYHRTYSANMYYQPVAQRKNLIVLTEAHVTGIITGIITEGNESTSVTATGVTFVHEGKENEVKCAKEVCLCAGTIMSPQILELSGIGNRTLLEKVGIPVKIDLPGVGENIQEHLFFGVTYDVKTPIIDGREVQTMNPLMNRDPEAQKKRLEEYNAGKGVFHLNTTSLAFIPLDTISSHSNEIHENLSNTIRKGIESNAFPKGLQKQYEVQLDHIKKKVAGLEIALAAGPVVPAVDSAVKKNLSLCFASNSPFSRGTIHVRSKDPLVPPIIDPHVFEQPYDLISLVELVKFNRKLAKTEPFKSILSDVEVYPGPDVETDDQIADWLKNVISTTFHTVGSCSMVPLEDGGVVDPKFKVYNTTNIRVVDLSIVPLHIGSHTQVMAYTLAEIAADVIKGVI